VTTIPEAADLDYSRYPPAVYAAAQRTSRLDVTHATLDSVQVPLTVGRQLICVAPHVPLPGC
jgi:hypothetical protein